MPDPRDPNIPPPPPGTRVETPESLIGKDFHDIEFTVEETGGRKFFKRSSPDVKIMTLEDGAEFEPQPGSKYEVVVLQDTRPGEARRGKLIVRITAEDGVPVHERRERGLGLPSPIEIDRQSGVVYILEHSLPLGSGGPRVPSADKFKYFTLDERTLAVIEKVAIARELGHPCLLEGETAVTKTSAIEYVDFITNRETYRYNSREQSDPSDLVGKFVPNDGELAIRFRDLVRDLPKLKPEARRLVEEAHTQGRGLTKIESMRMAELEGLQVPEWKWQDGMLITAMRRGGTFLWDEINLAPGPMRERFNSVLEKPPTLVIAENDGYMFGRGGDEEIATGFSIAATKNPLEYGSDRKPMSPAELNRWTQQKYVLPPDEKQYAAMLELMVFGKQPKVKIRGVEYQAPNVEPRFGILRRMENVGFFAARIAKFQAALEARVREGKIGRGMREPYSFARRNVIDFMEFLEAKKLHNRADGTYKTIEDDPKRLVLMGIEQYYMDILRNDDDRKEVTTQLEALGLTEDTWNGFERAA